MKFYGVLTVFLGALAALGGCTTSADVTSLCDLTSSPDKFSGKRVSISAVYITDRRHTSSLIDNRCKDVHVDPYFANAQPDSGLAKFDAAVDGEMRDMSLRVFSIEATGKFEWDPATKQGKLLIDNVSSYRRTTLQGTGLGANNSFKPNPLRGSA